ncbi:MAG TPA: hypothetical protein VJV39_03275 [Dongiaceae bacterium]|nr:hypothetical protein [Dongiaceae bacterium]
MSPYVAEMPLAGFKSAELFLLTTLRLWLAAHRRAQVPDWRQGLAAAAWPRMVRLISTWRCGCCRPSH